MCSFCELFENKGQPNKSPFMLFFFFSFYRLWFFFTLGERKHVKEMPILLIKSAAKLRNAINLVCQVLDGTFNQQISWKGKVHEITFNNFTIRLLEKVKFKIIPLNNFSKFPIINFSVTGKGFGLRAGYPDSFGIFTASYDSHNIHYSWFRHPKIKFDGWKIENIMKHLEENYHLGKEKQTDG